MSISWKYRDHENYIFTDEERQFTVSWKRNKLCLFDDSKSKIVQRFECHHRRPSGSELHGYDRLVGSMISPHGLARSAFSKASMGGIPAILFFDNIGKAKHMLSEFLVDRLVDMFFRICYGYDEDDDDHVTHAQIYAAGRMKVTQFKDSYLVKLVPFPHKYPFDGFKLVISNHHHQMDLPSGVKWKDCLRSLREGGECRVSSDSSSSESSLSSSEDYVSDIDHDG